MCSHPFLFKQNHKDMCIYIKPEVVFGSVLLHHVGSSTLFCETYSIAYNSSPQTNTLRLGPFFMDCAHSSVYERRMKHLFFFFWSYKWAYLDNRIMCYHKFYMSTSYSDIRACMLHFVPLSIHPKIWGMWAGGRRKQQLLIFNTFW